MFIDTVTALMLKSKIFIINNKLCYVVYICIRFDYANSRVYTTCIYSHPLHDARKPLAAHNETNTNMTINIG